MFSCVLCTLMSVHLHLCCLLSPHKSNPQIKSHTYLYTPQLYSNLLEANLCYPTYLIITQNNRTHHISEAFDLKIQWNWHSGAGKTTLLVHCSPEESSEAPYLGLSTYAQQKRFYILHIVTQGIVTVLFLRQIRLATNCIYFIY